MPKQEPERSCIITRTVKPKEELLRFVVGPGKVIVPDIDNKLPGRGIYLSTSRLMLAEALAKRAFLRAAQTQVTVPDGLPDTIETQLRRRVADALSLARKSGQVITGFEKVEESVKKGEVEALVHASDAGEDGIKKLSYYRGPTFTFLPRDLLCEVLARENAVHAAVTHGPAAAFFIQAARRFALFLD